MLSEVCSNEEEPDMAWQGPVLQLRRSFLKAELKPRRAKKDTDTEKNKTRPRACGMVRLRALPTLNDITFRTESREDNNKCAKKAIAEKDAIIDDVWESLNMDETLVPEVDCRLS
jgi:hypothetical protein